MAKRAGSMEGFLPKKAIVMGKKKSESKKPVHAKSYNTAPVATRISSTEALPSDWNELKQMVASCKKCGLCKTRTNTVFSDGTPKAKLMFIGEAPGEQEDLTGTPFVGRAGQLLTKMIEAMGLKREEIVIINMIKCRPPENRYPEPDEMAACNPYLMKQIEMVKPEVIVGLGKCAATLIGSTETISRLRGKYQTFDTGKFKTTQFMPTFHPSYLLRNPAAKKEVWEDLQTVAKTLGIKIPSIKSTEKN